MMTVPSSTQWLLDRVNAERCPVFGCEKSATHTVWTTNGAAHHACEEDAWIMYTGPDGASMATGLH